MAAAFKTPILFYLKECEKNRYNGEASSQQCADMLLDEFVLAMDQIKLELSSAEKTSGLSVNNKTWKPTVSKESLFGLAGEEFCKFRDAMNKSFNESSIEFQHHYSAAVIHILVTAMHAITSISNNSEIIYIMGCCNQKWKHGENCVEGKHILLMIQSCIVMILIIVVDQISEGELGNNYRRVFSTYMVIKNYTYMSTFKSFVSVSIS